MSFPASKTTDATTTLDDCWTRAIMSTLRREKSLLSLLYDDDQEFYREYVLASGNGPLCTFPGGLGLFSMTSPAIPSVIGGIIMVPSESLGQPMLSSMPLFLAPPHESSSGIRDTYANQRYPFESAFAAMPPAYTIDERHDQHVSHAFDAGVQVPVSVTQPLHAHSAASAQGRAAQVGTSYVSNGLMSIQHASSSRNKHAIENGLGVYPHTPHTFNYEGCYQQTPIRAYSTAPIAANNTNFHVLAPEGTALGNTSAEGQVPSALGDATIPAPKEGRQKGEKRKNARRATRAAAGPYPAPQKIEQGIPDINDEYIRDEADREALDTMRHQPFVGKALQSEDQRRCVMHYAPKLGKAGVLRDPVTGKVIFEICKAHEVGRLFVDRRARDRHVQEHHGLLNLIGCPKCGKKHTFCLLDPFPVLIQNEGGSYSNDDDRTLSVVRRGLVPVGVHIAKRLYAPALRALETRLWGRRFFGKSSSAHTFLYESAKSMKKNAAGINLLWRNSNGSVDVFTWFCSSNGHLPSTFLDEVVLIS
ncbi:hypothetical protein K488DRAFT_67673 [Vararia minispora EC-137]|uniref:Uncharacterized protein n=1 Tax=Vararia minispora EC-137 TaxID=1314806 RepID=A0ACB8QYC3_9AGAM|nr:hypothetical protein K488DRAFT_67673 [Vararia minispora EC-137]